MVRSLNKISIQFYVMLFFCFVFSFILLTHERSQREVYRDFQPSYDIFRRVVQTTGSVHLQPAQLLTWHQHGANNQYRTANQI